MNRGKVAFFDISFHKKTGSGKFLRALIKSKGYKIDDFWDDQNINYSKIVQNNYNFVFLFQYLPPLDVLKKVKVNIIWAPMYDSILNTPDLTFVKYLRLNIKILSFSKSTTRRFERLGFEVMEVQYFLEPTKFLFRRVNKLRLFLWQRRNINMSAIKKFFDLREFEEVVIKIDPDPGYRIQLPSPSDFLKYHPKIITGHLSKKEYFRLLDGCNLFLSPRDFEGIGMTFLEAIARGKLVIAKNNPTMNEYIQNGYDGILFNKPERINLDKKKIDVMVKNSLKKCEEGYKKWQIQRLEIVDFFTKERVRVSCLKYHSILLRTMAHHLIFVKLMNILNLL
jgi:uncharacterized protein YkuJ